MGKWENHQLLKRGFGWVRCLVVDQHWIKKNAGETRRDSERLRFSVDRPNPNIIESSIIYGLFPAIGLPLSSAHSSFFSVFLYAWPVRQTAQLPLPWFCQQFAILPGQDSPNLPYMRHHHDPYHQEKNAHQLQEVTRIPAKYAHPTSLADGAAIRSHNRPARSSSNPALHLWSPAASFLSPRFYTGWVRPMKNKMGQLGIR